MLITKRSGKKVPFDSEKIKNAIKAVFTETDTEIAPQTLDNLTKEVTAQVKDGYHVEQIQDIVEDVLIKNGWVNIAKSYIRYRERHAQSREQWITEELPMDIFERKYRFEGESFEEFFDRVAQDNTRIRKLIKDKMFLPAGRILANRMLHEHGIKVTYSNCYVTRPPEDSIEEIIDAGKRLARTFSRGGGSGVDISKLRPTGAKVMSAAKTTSGAVSFLDIYDAISKKIGQKGRRAALMTTLSCEHPDIEEFIDKKHDLDAVTKANMSVRITDEFMNAAINDEPYTLRFDVLDTPEVIEKEVSADKLLNKMAYSNWYSGEPGALFWDTINNYTMLERYDDFEFAGTNPCLVGDTLVQTVEGNIPIRKLVDKNPMVYTMRANGRLGVAKATKVWKTREKAELVRVETYKGDIECTPDHKIYTQNRGWVEAQNLSQGDKIKGLNRQMSNERTCSVGLSGEGYEKEHRFILGHFEDIEGKDVHHKNNNPLDNRLSNLESMLHGEHSSVSNLGHPDWGIHDDMGRYSEKAETRSKKKFHLDKDVGKNWFVKNVKKLNKKAPVYDMEVPTTHNFVANNMVVHNCGEEPLPAGGSCLLGALNLSNFVINEFDDRAKFDFDNFKIAVEDAVFYLNEILEEGLPLHPLDEQRKSVEDWRQIGVGLMGLGSMFIKMGIRYGSDESLELSERIGKIMANSALQASAKVAKEEGTFPKYNEEATLDSYYINNVATEETVEMIKKYGLRNSQVLTIAPTGSISNICGVSGGIEPIYKVSYWRTTKSLHGEDREYKVFSPVVKKLMEAKGIKDENDLPDYVTDAHRLDYKERIQMQATWQEYIDASISSTINLDNDVTVQEIRDIYVKAWENGLKGLTIFRDGCARVGILKGDDEMKDKKTEMSDQDWIDAGICPECKSSLDMTGGCKECTNCGFQLCGI